MKGTAILSFHGRLLRDTFGRDISDSDAFLLFTLFHSHRIELAGPVLTDCRRADKQGPIAAISQEGCSRALASVWRGTGDERGHYGYWSWRWADWGSYGHAENLTEEEQTRLRELIAKLEDHAFVRRFVPDD